MINARRMQRTMIRSNGNAQKPADRVYISPPHSNLQSLFHRIFVSASPLVRYYSYYYLSSLKFLHPLHPDSFPINPTMAIIDRYLIPLQADETSKVSHHVIIMFETLINLFLINIIRRDVSFIAFRAGDQKQTNVYFHPSSDCDTRPSRFPNFRCHAWRTSISKRSSLLESRERGGYSRER